MRSRRVAHGCDALLDVLVLAFAAWTLVYGACLLLRVPADWATAAGALAALACLAFPPPAPAGDEPPRSRPRPRGAAAIAALATAGLAALGAPWPVVWLPWLAVAAATLLGTDEPDGATTGGAVTAALWAAVLAALSLFLVRPDSDDTHYVHTATWVAERGTFPLRDTLYSDERYEALFFPPWTSIEALHGCLARALGVEAATVVYLGAAPAGAVLATAALWRLLRTWRVPHPGLALSTAVVFLLVAAFDERHRTPGRFFVDRMWQGKAVFVAALVPLAFALLAERPGRRRLILLAATGVAGVGLTTSAVFVLPVIAAGAALAGARRAAAALAAFPLLAGAVTVAVGARNPDLGQAHRVAAGELARESLASGLLAFVAVTAILVGPLLIPRGRMVAGAALVAAVLLTPGAPRVLMTLTGIGEALWRVLWAVPVAALVGVLAGRGPLPAAALCAVLLGWAVATGPPDTVSLAPEPAWKRPHLADARIVVARARPGDLVLAPQPLGQTLLAISTKVTTVDARGFYTRALARNGSGAHAWMRLKLQGVVQPRWAEARGRFAHDDPVFVARALRVLGVDVVCGATRPVAGYERRLPTREVVCVARR